MYVQVNGNGLVRTDSENVSYIFSVVITKIKDD